MAWDGLWQEGAPTFPPLLLPLLRQLRVAEQEPGAQDVAEEVDRGHEHGHVLDGDEVEADQEHREHVQVRVREVLVLALDRPHDHVAACLVVDGLHDDGPAVQQRHEEHQRVPGDGGEAGLGRGGAQGRGGEMGERVFNSGEGVRYSPLARPRPPKKGSIDGPPKILPRLTPGPRR